MHAGCQLNEAKVILPKYDQQEFGGELVYMRACRTVRVTYSTVVERATGPASYLRPL